TRLCRFMIQRCDKDSLDTVTEVDSTTLSPPELLRFDYSPTLHQAIINATKTFEWQVKRHELGILHYEEYGKGLIKKFKVSPDAYVQMAIQLAYYRMFGQLKA